MNRKMKNRRAFAAVTLSILLLTVCFTGAAFAESNTESNTKSKDIAVNFEISQTPISFVISEKITAGNGDGATSVLTFDSLLVRNDGYIGITIEKIEFKPETEGSVLADSSDFANMAAGAESFSVLAKYGENDSSSYDFSNSSPLAPNVVLGKGESFSLKLSGHTAPQYEAVTERDLGDFVVTVSKKTAAVTAAESGSEPAAE